MTIPPKAKRRDLRAALIAVLLLLACGALWVWTSSDARDRRQAALSSVPDFPSRGQPASHARRPLAQAPRLPPPPVLRADAGQPPPPRQRIDSMTSFVLHPAHTIGVVNVNALLNTPLFAKIKECLPLRFERIAEQSSRLGIDFERDLDRVALFEGGVAMSGFFAGKPVAESIAAAAGQPTSTETYRGTTIYSSQRFAVAQIGNVVVQGSTDQIRGLVDRVLDPPPASADPQDVYGDVFLRSDLEGLREGRKSGDNSARDAMGAMLDSLGGLTARANVWDSVALSLEGTPRGGASVGELAKMARGAIQLARDQVDQEEVELSTLADLARVAGTGDELRVDLALPAKDLFEKLHFPCPGRNEPAQPRRSPGPNVPVQN